MSRWNRPMRRYVPSPAPEPAPKILERIEPGLWRHLPTGRLIVKQEDGWVLAFDTAHGVLPEARPEFKTLRKAARFLNAND